MDLGRAAGRRGGGDVRRGTASPGRRRRPGRKTPRPGGTRAILRAGRPAAPGRELLLLPRRRQAEGGAAARLPRGDPRGGRLGAGGRARQAGREPADRGGQLSRARDAARRASWPRRRSTSWRGGSRWAPPGLPAIARPPMPRRPRTRPASPRGRRRSPAARRPRYGRSGRSVVPRCRMPVTDSSSEIRTGRRTRSTASSAGSSPSTA